MAVNRNIGLLTGIINTVKNLSSRVNINPVTPLADKKIDYSMLKAKVVTKVTEGTSGVFHWNFHNWGDKNNVVGQ
jgi:hypothetical protein